MGPFVPRRGKVKETPIDHDAHWGVINSNRRIACTTCAWVGDRSFATHTGEEVMSEWADHRVSVGIARVWA